MGLLSNVKIQKAVGDAIEKYSNKVCFFTFVVGIIWFCLLSKDFLNAHTYFSENALLTGLVTPEFSDGETKNIHKEFKAAIANITSSAERKEIIFSLVYQKFLDIGLATNEQNFSFQTPLGLMKEPNFGKNIYGILRAPRLAGTEAIVINVPYEDKKSICGLSLMLGLANFFRRRAYWAKDIIFLVTDFEAYGMQAWISAYHGYFLDYKQQPAYGELFERSGSIQAAIILQLPKNTINGFNIKIEGYNGQLPNLDLVNTAVRLSQNAGIPTMLQERLDQTYDEDITSVHSLITMFLMMLNQITGSSTGNHGFFQNYHIEALTLQGVKIEKSVNFEFLVIGRVIEGIIRSINNLLERFHQSFFFYLLPSANRYVSIGLYMPPFGLMIIATLLKGVALWIAVSRSSEVEEKPTSCDNITGESNENKESIKENKSEISDSVVPHSASQNQLSLLGLIPLLFIAILFGLAAYYIPKHSVPLAEAFLLSPSTGMVIGAAALQCVACFYPLLILRKSKQLNVQLFPDWRLQKCFALLTFGIITAVVAIMNISFGTFVTVLWTPVILTVRPVSSKLIHVGQCIALLLIAPLILHAMTCGVFVLATDVGLHNFDIVLLKIWKKFSSSLLNSVIDNYMFGNWTFSLCTLVYFPIWLQFWTLIWNNNHVSH